MAALQTDIPLYMANGYLGQLQGAFYAYKTLSVAWAGSPINQETLAGRIVSFAGGSTKLVDLTFVNPDPALLAGIVVKSNTIQNSIATGVPLSDELTVNTGDSLTILVKGEINAFRISPSLPEGGEGPIYVDSTNPGQSGGLKATATGGGDDVDVSKFISKVYNYTTSVPQARVFIDLTYNLERGI